MLRAVRVSCAADGAVSIRARLQRNLFTPGSESGSASGSGSGSKQVFAPRAESDQKARNTSMP